MTSMDAVNITPAKRTFSEINQSAEHDLPCSVDQNACFEQPYPKQLQRNYNPGKKLSFRHLIELLTPRRYSVQLVDTAMKKNIVAVLSKDDNKVAITLMLIEEVGKAIMPIDQKKYVVFLTPTINLVNQQYKLFKSHTNLKVCEYFGSNQLEESFPKFWEKEMAENDVLVLTPEIFLCALRVGFVKLDVVSLLIFDECHLATGSHAYAQIMKEFYHTVDSKPKVFGITASRAVIEGTNDCNNLKSELESILDSQIFTADEGLAMKNSSNYNSISHRFYDRTKFDLSKLKAAINSVWVKFSAWLSALQPTVQQIQKLNRIRKKLSDEYCLILACLEDLGILCAHEAVSLCLMETHDPNDEFEFFEEISIKRKQLFDEVLRVIEKSQPAGNNLYATFTTAYAQALELGYISPKVFELIVILKDLRDRGYTKCLVFVESLYSAEILEKLVERVSYPAQISVTYLAESSDVGMKTSKQNFEGFCNEKVNGFPDSNLLENLGIPIRSCLIMFDIPVTLSCYVNSRYIAQQTSSTYVLMLERENVIQRDQIFDIVIRSEQSLNEAKVSYAESLESCLSNLSEEYILDDTGVSVSRRSTVGMLYEYCETLADHGCYDSKPTFEYEYFQNFFQCSVKLPSKAAIQAVVGPLSKSLSLAKQLVCLEACKKLHQVNALNTILPSANVVKEDPSNHKRKGSCAGAGTTKRKELHGTAQIHALSGNWKDEKDGASFNAYKITSIGGSDDYAEYVLLLETKLDADVGNISIELYNAAKIVKTSITFCGEANLDFEQITKAKHFHELFFNGLFGTLFSGSKEIATHEFLLQDESWSLWNTAKMYLLLPLMKPDNITCWRIDWKAVGASSSAVEFLRKRTTPGSKPDVLEYQTGTESMATDVLQFANARVDRDSVLGMVVLSIHTGRIYVILDVRSNTSARSPFMLNANSRKSKSYATFAEYYQKKYNISLKYPEQQLLELKQSHNPHNLLVNFYDEAGGKNEVAEGGQYVQIPPELLFFMGIPARVLKPFYLFPSILQRLQSLMLASQLRDQIHCRLPTFQIPSSLILEAITTVRCSESFSSERLELLGDSVLKYAASCCLYLKYADENEGQHSERRKRTVCNEALHRVGTSRKLQGYIRDYPFEPLQWTAPGHKLRPLTSRTCCCDVDGNCDSDSRSIKIGMPCEMGHRWLVSKSIADCVEAVIGAYYVSGGIEAAVCVINWLGIDAHVDSTLVKQAISGASLRAYIPKEDDIKNLESKLGYSFAVKWFLQEAITHASMREEGASHSYEKLEFLGDAVLDLLITWHLFQNHSDVDPGELTDLRTASVNNDYFALIAVTRDLFVHLNHRSSVLQNQIADYVKSLSDMTEVNRAQPPNGPKALGDMVESIAGSILIDTELDLQKVWAVFKPMLSPIVTPQELQLHPWRMLSELCDSHGYFIKEKRQSDGKVEVSVQLNDGVLVGEGSGASNKIARAKAAQQLVAKLEKRGIKHSRDLKRKRDKHAETATPDEINVKKKKIEEDVGSAMPSQTSAAVTVSMNTKKGGPRISLYEFCKKVQWPMPTFATAERKSRSPMEFDDGVKKRAAYVGFVTTVTLNIPEKGAVECAGDLRPDKKASLDSAALNLLALLQHQRQLTIVPSNDLSSL